MTTEAAVWLRGTDGRVWEVRAGTEEERRLLKGGAERCEPPRPDSGGATARGMASRA